MISIKTAACSLSILALTAGAALAQNTMTTGSMSNGAMNKGAMSSGSMSSGAMAKPMSAADTKMMKSCQAMDHDMMMKNSGCKKMMKKHPMASDGGMTTH